MTRDSGHHTPTADDGDMLEEASPHRDQARIDTVIDGFRIVERLGRGGHASVFRAVHEDGRAIAIKILHAEHGDDARARKRLLREAYVANRIGHPNIPHVLADGVTPDGAAYLMIEFCEGQSLQEKSEMAPGALAWEDLARWMDELLDVLAVAHDLGIVHRDIKPGNLLVTQDGRLKVLDFGIARVTAASELPSIVTKTGAVLGTPHFMPPEQAIGNSDEIDARSDLWSVGATMFTLITARYVHPARSINEAIVLAATQKAPKIRSVKPDVPGPIAAVIDRALAFDRNARFRNAGAMQTALRQALRGETIETPQVDAMSTLPEESELIPPPEHVPVHTPAEVAPVVPRKRWFPLAIAIGLVATAVTAMSVWPGTWRQTSSIVVSSGSIVGNELATASIPITSASQPNPSIDRKEQTDDAISQQSAVPAKPTVPEGQPSARQTLTNQVKRPLNKTGRETAPSASSTSEIRTSYQ